MDQQAALRPLGVLEAAASDTMMSLLALIGSDLVTVIAPALVAVGAWLIYASRRDRDSELRVSYQAAVRKGDRYQARRLSRRGWVMAVRRRDRDAVEFWELRMRIEQGEFR